MGIEDDDQASRPVLPTREGSLASNVRELDRDGSLKGLTPDARVESQIQEEKDHGALMSAIARKYSADGSDESSVESEISEITMSVAPSSIDSKRENPREEKELAKIESAQEQKRRDENKDGRLEKEEKISPVSPLQTMQITRAVLEGEKEKEQAGNSAQTRNDSLTPPPPGNELRRNQYLRSNPGAVAVPGTSQDSVRTILVGDDRDSGPAAQVNPLLDATLVKEEDEAEEGRVERSRAVTAEPMPEEKPKSFCASIMDGRVCAVIICLVLSVAGIVAGVTIFLINKEPATEISAELNVTETPTPGPSSSPTIFLEFDPPSPADCAAIANATDVDAQDDLIMKLFEIRLDVTFGESSADNIPSLFNTLQGQLQKIMGPFLAGCDDINRLLIEEPPAIRGARKLSKKYVVGNALFSFPSPDQLIGCKAEEPNVCYKVFLDLQLYVKGEERIAKLIALISGGFAEDLVKMLLLGEPFKGIKFVAISTDATDSPTTAPTMAPTRKDDTRRPTPQPTFIRDNPVTPSPTVSLQNVCA